MNRREIIRILYVGGQTAIGVELLVIVGVVGFLLSGIEILQYNLQDITDFYSVYQTMLEIVRQSSVGWVIGSMLTTVIPSGVMLIVVWAWHLYFASEGVHLMNWAASSIAIIGATINISLGGLNAVGIPILIEAIDAGHLPEESGFLIYIVGLSFSVMGLASLYAVYPLALVIASWQKRLIPRWFVLVVIFTFFLNDVVVLMVPQNPWLLDVMDIVRVIWPFLMGVAMLRKAQALATEDYIDAYGTPPPTVSAWESVQLLISTPSRLQDKSDETASTE